MCIRDRNNDEVIATVYERILGRVSVHDIVHPTTGKLIVAGGEEITEDIACLLYTSLVNLTVKEVNELATILKEEYGIEPVSYTHLGASGMDGRSFQMFFSGSPNRLTCNW